MEINFKKTLLFWGIIISVSSSLQAQWITSVVPGFWSDTTTWDCNCVPDTSGFIRVKHSVVLDVNVGLNQGNMTIFPEGILSDSGNSVDLDIKASFVENSGLLEIGQLILESSELNNMGTMVVRILGQKSGEMLNSGILTVSDSLRLKGEFIQTQNGTLQTVDFAHDAISYNFGTISSVTFTNDSLFYQYALFNAQVFTNLSTAFFQNDSLVQCVELYNQGELINSDQLSSHSFWNEGIATMEENAVFEVELDFLNLGAQVAGGIFENDGEVYVGRDWLNQDSVIGTGLFCIAEGTRNDGLMDGEFEFCDATPPLDYPFIDVNNGFVGAGIAFCSSSCLPLSRNDIELLDQWLYPNPFSDVLKVDMDALQKEASVAVFYTMSGRSFRRLVNDGKIDTSELLAGGYWVELLDRKGIRLYSLKLLKTR